MILKHSFTTSDRELEIIEGCLSGREYETLHRLKPPLRAAILTSNTLDPFLHKLGPYRWSKPELVRSLDGCKSIIILRPHCQLIVYGSDGVSPLTNLWARLWRGDPTALEELDAARTAA